MKRYVCASQHLDSNWTDRQPPGLPRRDFGATPTKPMALAKCQRSRTELLERGVSAQSAGGRVGGLLFRKKTTRPLPPHLPHRQHPITVDILIRPLPVPRLRQVVYSYYDPLRLFEDDTNQDLARPKATSATCPHSSNADRRPTSLSKKCQVPLQEPLTAPPWARRCTPIDPKTARRSTRHLLWTSAGRASLAPATSPRVGQTEWVSQCRRAAELSIALLLSQRTTVAPQRATGVYIAEHSKDRSHD